GVDKPIGVSEYELTRALPINLRSALPSVEEIEAELGESEPTGESIPRPKGPNSVKKKKVTKKNKKRKSS
ncbi:MAG TPA: hypothetical protein VGM98_20165, partial [Schlesneria sp.]